MEDNELEEGEACFYQDDSNYDPDVALSYIDVKLQDVLGHFQKEFEGGVSAENLGAKFGGYGSFLPTHQRSPSVLLQPKTPANCQNNGTQKSPNEGTVERMRRIAVSSATVSQPAKLPSASNDVLCTSAVPAADIADKREIAAVTTKASGEDLPCKKESSGKNVNGSDQKTLKLRIKMGSDSVRCRKNTAIYSGLGLENSPSPSLEDSPDTSQEIFPGSGFTPRSPLSMIRTMTSHQIPGGFLLTPLRHTLVQVSEREDKPSANGGKAMKIKAEIQECRSTNKNDSELVKDLQVSKEKKGRISEKNGKYVETKKEADSEMIRNSANNFKKDAEFENRTSRESGSNILKLPTKSSSKGSHHRRVKREIVGDSEKETLKGCNISKEIAKGTSKEAIFSSDLARDENKGADENRDQPRMSKSEGGLVSFSGKQSCKQQGPVQAKEGRKESGNKNSVSDVRKLAKETAKDCKKPDSLKDVIGLKERNELKDATKETSKEKVSDKVVTSEMIGMEKEHISVNKRKQKDMSRNINSCKEASKEKSMHFSIETYKDQKKDMYAKDSLTSEMLGEGSKARKESSKAYLKDYHREYAKDVGQEQTASRKDSIDLYCKDNMKESKFGHLDKGSSRVYEREKENEHGVTKLSVPKNLEHSSTNEIHPSNAAVSQPLTGGVMGADAGLVQAAPVVINENWVLCDACEKWRLLPFGMDPSSLPKKWLCRMLDWLPEMNRCDVSEDETTHALYAMYGMLPGQAQVDTNKGLLQPPEATISAPIRDIKQAEPIQEGKTLRLSTVPSNSRKGQAHKSIPNVPGSTNLPASLIKKNKHSSVKSKSLNDVVQQPLEQIPGSIGVSNQALKGNNAVLEKHKHKQKEKWTLRQNSSNEVGHATEQDHTPSLKTKRRREGELDGHKHAKKGRVEGNVGAGGDFLLDTDSIDRVGPSRNGNTHVKLSSGKAKKLEHNSSSKRDVNLETREGLQFADKKLKDQLQPSIETDSRGTYSGFDMGIIDRKDFSTKKRKIKEWKESKAAQEGRPEDHTLDGRSMMKEEESETENRREKKTRTSKEGKESSASKTDDKSETKGKVTRIMVSSNRDILSSGMEEQSKGDFEKEHESGQSRGRCGTQRLPDGLDNSKRDLGYRQHFAAATSSSSKVSCSLKNLANFQEVRGSPVESVSSSPLRISKVEKISSARRNSVGMDDLMDTSFPYLASPRRCSDVEGGPQRDHSRPVRKKKNSCVEQPGSHESCRGVHSAVLNSGRPIGENCDTEGRQFSDVKAKEDRFGRKLNRGSIDASHFATEYGNINLVNGVNISEQRDICFNERRGRERSQEKLKGCYNLDGCPERRGSREKLTREQGGEMEKNSAHEKGKDKMHDSISDGHEECYIGIKNFGCERNDRHPEGHAHSPYHEASRDGKESADHKCSHKSERDRRNDIEMNSKRDSRLKKSGEGRNGIQSKHAMDENTEVPTLDLHAKQNGDYISKHGKAGAMLRRDGKGNVQQSLQQAPSCGGEKAYNQLFSDKNIQSVTASARGKYQTIPCSGDEPELQGHGFVAGSMVDKSTRLEGLAVDASNEFLRVPREANKADNSNTVLSSGLKPPASNGFLGRDPEGATTSPIRKEHGQVAANAMKEATDLKHSADRLKNTGGNERESTGLYFRAALKFLHAASLLEPGNAEIAKHGETTQSMTLYTETARLCEFCAVTYERNKEIAAAALAYKCMGVAHMRVVVSKNVCLCRDRHELQTAVQMIPPGESPSSSASDVDNLNNHAMMDKGSSVNPAKVVGSPQAVGNHVIVARNRPHFLRILQYTQDVNAAIEAFRKSESAFAAAHGSLDDANYGTDGISAVKRVIDFGFHDIDGLLRLVRLAMEAIYH